MEQLIRTANKAFIKEVLKNCLSPMQEIARQSGYALAVHGSLARDIDLIAVPWVDEISEVEDMHEADFLIERFRHYLEKCFGSACLTGETGIKPHGRQAYTIIVNGTNVWFDINVMPTTK